MKREGKRNRQMDGSARGVFFSREPIHEIVLRQEGKTIGIRQGKFFLRSGVLRTKNLTQHDGNRLTSWPATISWIGSWKNPSFVLAPHRECRANRLPLRNQIRLRTIGVPKVTTIPFANC